MQHRLQSSLAASYLLSFNTWRNFLIIFCYIDLWFRIELRSVFIYLRPLSLGLLLIFIIIQIYWRFIYLQYLDLLKFTKNLRTLVKMGKSLNANCRNWWIKWNFIGFNIFHYDWKNLNFKYCRTNLAYPVYYVDA